jgi:hypothetical protein
VQAWGDHIIGRLRPKAKALFQAGRFVDVDGERAVYGLPNETHRTRCEEVHGEIEAALSEHFGRPVGVVLVVDGAVVPHEETVAGPSAAPAAPPVTRPASAPPTPPVVAPVDDELEDLASFDESELGEVADVDNSAQTRVLQAFPGAEEVS